MDDPTNKLDSADSNEPEGESSLEGIFERKRRLYTLVVLGFLFVISAIVSMLAFAQGIFVRQVVNTTVMIITLVCIVVIYRDRERVVRWPIYVAILFLHILVTSGFISNGGVALYAASTLPVVPIVTALLLGQTAAVFSVVYVLCLGILSGVLIAHGVHPSNITAIEHQTAFAVIITCLSIVAAFVGVYSMMVTTKLSEAEVRAHTKMLENEIDARLLAEEKVRKASEEKSQFLSAISHELRTPLNSIIGFTKLLTRLDLSKKGAECTDQIAASSDELLTKVNNLLEFTEILFNKAHLKEAPFVVKDILEQLKREFSEKASNSNNTLVFDNAGVGDCVVVSDAEKLMTILSNIIDNALKFTQGGDVNVSTELETSNEQITLVCRVRDTGAGIPESAFENLFVVFTQSDMSSSRAYEGIGLGLASSYQLVSLLEGKLEASNNPDKGCTMLIRVPVSLPK